MKKRWLYVLVLLVVCVLCNAVKAEVWPGAWSGYDPKVEDEMPDSNWILENGVTPIRRLVGGHAVTADGIAHLDCNNTTTGHHRHNTNFDTSKGLTVDFRVKDLSNSSTRAGVAVSIGVDNEFRVIIKVHGHDGVSETNNMLTMAWSDGGENNTISIGNTPDVGYYHIWRFTVLGSSYKVYADDRATPIAEGTVTTADRNMTYVDFGDWGSSVNGNADLDYVVWNESRAYFMPPLPLLKTGTVILVR